MTPFDAKTHWQNVYLSKAPSELSWYQAEPTLSLQLINRCGLQLTDPIIDVGGGASVLVDRLLDSGYSGISVLDVAGEALAASRGRLGVKAERARWLECDITAYSPQTQFSVWHDRAVFHFLTDPADRTDYVSALTDGLSPGGYLILASFAIGGPEMCSGLPIVQYDGDKLQRELGPGFDLVEQRNESHATPSGRKQEFAYFRFVRSSV